MTSNLKFRSLAAFALVVAMALPAAAASKGALGLIPNDAVSVGMVKLADARTSPITATLFQHADKVSADGDAAKFLADAGLQPSKDVDVLIVATSPRTALGNEAEVLVAAEGRFNIDRLSKALLDRGATRKGAGAGAYLVLPDSKTEHSSQNGAVAFPEAGLAVIGSESAVIEALAARSNGGTSFATASGLGRELGRVDARASAWVLVDVTRAQRLTNSPDVPNGRNNAGQALGLAMKNMRTVALWATDAGDSVKLGAFGLSNDGETLQLVEDTLRGALSAMRLAVQEKAPDLVSVLRRFSVSRTDDSVTLTGSIPAETLRTLAAKKHASK